MVLEKQYNKHNIATLVHNSREIDANSAPLNLYENHTFGKYVCSKAHTAQDIPDHVLRSSFANAVK